MEHKHDFKFIDSDFTPDEAKRVLRTLIYQKISFHQLEVFSNTERFGHDVTHSKIRIAQLDEVFKEMEKVLNYASDNNLKVNVHSNIHLVLEENNDASH